MTSLRSCLVGCWMGITPGGATPASFMSYGIAKRMSPDGAKFGTGQIEGVIAPETAAHAAGTSALLPMIVPGHTGFAHGGSIAGRLVDLGLTTGAAAVCGEKGFRVGPDRQHVSGQYRGPDYRAHLRAAVRGDIAHPVLDHCAVDHRHLRHWRLHRAQRHASTSGS